MIQRVQTIYLLLSVIATGLLLILPVWESNYLTDKITIDMINAINPIFLFPIWAILLIIQLIAVFLFKKRRRQILLVSTGITLNIVFIVMVMIFAGQEIDAFSIKNFKIGAILPLVSIVLLILANKNIRKDEELIRSMNRLR